MLQIGSGSWMRVRLVVVAVVAVLAGGLVGGPTKAAAPSEPSAAENRSNPVAKGSNPYNCKTVMSQDIVDGRTQ